MQTYTQELWKGGIQHWSGLQVNLQKNKVIKKTIFRNFPDGDDARVFHRVPARLVRVRSPAEQQVQQDAHRQVRMLPHIAHLLHAVPSEPIAQK